MEIIKVGVIFVWNIFVSKSTSTVTAGSFEFLLEALLSERRVQCSWLCTGCALGLKLSDWVWNGRDPEALVCIKEERNEVIWSEGGIGNCSTDTANRLTTDMSATISILLCQRFVRMKYHRMRYWAQGQRNRYKCLYALSSSCSFTVHIFFAMKLKRNLCLEIS
jgi:hypothetical protein